MCLSNLAKCIIPESLRPQALAVRQVEKHSNGRVISGPFQGMLYGSQAFGSAYYPKILGTYELEIHGLISDLIKVNFDSVINVGAGEGYYAVGLARSSANTRIIAYEMNPEAPAVIYENAKLNDVQERVIIKDYCSVDDLRQTLDQINPQEKSCLILMDVEGAELDLLKPDLIPALKQCHLLVELHDCYIPGLDDTIISLFQESHKQTRIWSVDRKTKHLPFHSIFLDERLLILTNEFRPKGMSWLYLEPKSKSL